MVGDPVGELDLERRQRGVPVLHLAPVGFGFDDREVDQFASCFFGREVPPGLDDLARLAVQGFDRVGRVDHAADVLGVGQERGDLLPAVKPALADRRVAGIPFVGERLQLIGGVVGVCRRVDLAQVGGDLLAVLVGDVLETRADLVHQTRLDG